MNTPSVDHILICGTGLAGHMAAAALSSQLPESVRMTLVDCQDNSDTDLFYGSVTGPSSYDFNLSAGVSEPRLVLESDTAFSFGTCYMKWAGRSWVQCFELPLPIPDQVSFHHYLTQQRIDDLEPFLISAMAARRGSFAHPPEQNDHPLSRAEYGYQFDPRSYGGLFAKATGRVEKIAAEISGIERDENGITAIRLSNGQVKQADLYVDCSGPKALLLSALGAAYSGVRRLRAAASRKSADVLGPPCRTVVAHDFGWQAETPLKGSTARLTVFAPEMEASALAAHSETPSQTAEVTIGRRPLAWCGNCVAVGHAAAVIEPLTHAPIMMLQRDLERLLSLIPLSGEMAVERREYNRQFDEDCTNIVLFHRALFEVPGLPDTPYWNGARSEAVPEKLKRKLELFESRGALVTYDLEPFNPEDWTILHYGIGRRPTGYDRVADKASAGKVREYLSNMRRGIENVVKAMPSHDIYVAKLTRYLMQQKG